jgi:hypothetical protein
MLKSEGEAQGVHARGLDVSKLVSNPSSSNGCKRSSKEKAGKPRALQGFQEMERIGIEPMTSSLQILLMDLSRLTSTSETE